MGRVEGGVNEGGGEVLSHLISLDTRHQASLKQPLSPCQIHGPVDDAAHAYTGHTLYTHTHTQRFKTKATQRQISQPPGAVIDRLLQRTGLTVMKISRGRRRGKGQRKG